jgi:very-short-patch-repair endonuclease
MYILNNYRHLKTKRKSLRNRSTFAEVILWRILKAKGLGTKFRRQHSIGNYILDFYCPSHDLAIELDGADHFTEAGLRYDALRDAYLNSLGITVLRIENDLVIKRTDHVIELIEQHLTK